ncbi:MAG: hypothetical protein K0Q95_177 [Bacteroidota bacterium]|jgi:hypothetical protein|nr:hypothetical protein [Bacteroidota bacterium]
MHGLFYLLIKNCKNNLEKVNSCVNFEFIIPSLLKKGIRANKLI